MSHPPSLSSEKRHFFYDEPKPFTNTLLEVYKLFDGLFIGNHHAGRELQFLSNNKISLILNLTPLELHLPSHKFITVLNYDFSERKIGEPLISLPLVLEIIAAMENCLRVKQEGVVMMGKSIDSRVLAFACIYLMIKFRWKSQEAINFIHQKSPNGDIAPSYVKALERFGSHKERNKLSQAFQTEDTPFEMLLLINTIQNSHTINMPNFHGLSFHKIETTIHHGLPPSTKKVKFRRQIQIINPSQPTKEKAVHSTSASKQIVQKVSKLSRVEKKFRQFIKDKCHMSKQPSNLSMKSAVIEEEDDIVFTKSKDITCRLPRKRAASKSEQSPFCAKKQQNTFDKMSDNDLLVLEFKDDQSLIKKSQPLKIVLPLEMNIKTLEGQPQGFQDDHSQRREKGYILHNSKRYRLPKKYHTEESTTTTSNAEPDKKYKHQKIESEPGQSATSYQMFKISKSSKTSTKKIKINASAMKTLGKESDKCIKIMEDSITAFEQSSKIKKEEENHHYSHQKIINFNLNVQIENINMIREKNAIDGEDKRPKMFARPHHSKKFSKIISNNLINDF